jgi:hypothetical protein
MTTSFCSISNDPRDAMLQTETNFTLVSPSDKGNAPIHPICIQQQQSSEWGLVVQSNDVGYRFAEPYSPEHNEFQPVPIAMSIEFVGNCTGPPWSVGDEIEMMRRKEMENMHPTFSANEYMSLPIASYFDVGFSGVQYYGSTQQNGVIGNIDLRSTVHSILEPTAETLERTRGFTHIKISSDAIVPLPYIRAKIPSYYQNFFLNETTATHDLYLTSINSETARLPVHDLVLVAQCMNISRLATLLPNGQKKKKEKDALHVEGVPDLNSFGILLKWLYTNNEDELYEILKTSCLGNSDLVVGFAMNCRFWGIVDTRVAAVVRALLQDIGWGLA